MLVTYAPLEDASIRALGNYAPTFNSANPSFFATVEFVYVFIFSLIVVAAFYRYVLAGIKRMQASEQAIRSSNDIIKQTTLGLLGIFSLFLILSLVNRDMLTGNVSLEAFRSTTALPPTSGTPATGSAGTTGGTASGSKPPMSSPLWQEALNDDARVRAYLRGLPNGGITVNKNVCPNIYATNCTTVGGLPQVTIDMLTQLRSTCTGAIVLTGGTEAGHSSHGPGMTPVDLGIGAEGCIRNFPRSSLVPMRRGSTPLCYPNQVYENFGYVFCDEAYGARHWHVFKR